MQSASRVFWVIAVIGVMALIVVGGYTAYWWFAKDTTARRYDVNTGTQQYQSSLISQERDNVIAWNRSVDPAQRAAISDQFCAIYPNLTPAPADLVTAHVSIC